MRKAITVGTKITDGGMVVLVPPSQPISKHLAYLRKTFPDGKSDTYSKVEMITWIGKGKKSIKLINQA